MPTGGIIFLTILALWAFYLVPVLVKERASRLDSRAADRTSPAVRVLQRPAAQRPSHRVVLTADRPVVSEELPARPTRDLAVRLRAEARTARVGVRARAAAALVGVLALLVAGVTTVLGVLPWWTLVVAGGWTAAVLVSGAVAASARRRAVEAPASAAATLPPRAHRVATEVFDGRVARLAGPATAGSAPARALSSSAGLTAAQRLTARRAADLAGVDAVDHELAGRADSGWTPVEVPSPVYASKPVSHRPPTLPWSMPAVAAPAVDESAGTGSEVAADVCSVAVHDAVHDVPHQVDHDLAQAHDHAPEQERRSATA